MPPELKPCGTTAAYERHRRAGEEACDACREARNTYTRERYVPSARELHPCGTVAAYQRHLRRGEEACRPCKDALTARHIKSAKQDPPPCGTNAGYQGHCWRGETPCDACRDARNAYQRAYRAAKASKRRRRAELDRILAEAWIEAAAAISGGTA